MGITLLIGNPKVSWREWLKANRNGQDLLCLDPADAVVDAPCRFTLLKGDKPVWSRFYGSLDPSRAPHVILTAIAQGVKQMDGGYIQLFSYRPTPLLRQVVTLASQIAEPTRILVAKGTDLSGDELTIGPEEVELEPAFPLVVQQAQRKAHWLNLISKCHPHTVNLEEVTIEGARFGSGISMNPDERERLGLKEAIYVERTGRALMIVSEQEPEESMISRALDLTGCNKANTVSLDAYEGVLCAFARQSGEEIGTGFIESIDWENRTATILCTAIPPVPVRILRIGSMKIDASGREYPESAPWRL